ncbi:restriction endonuclease subunit S [Vibrio cholerae]|nr:restriction endonuclease subunit S [Vibrio cholerae]ELH0869319.1 restriction endonuclease subunit S [Vibrio cholerae]ELJ8383986.1 restriction endonuclease subunit S [Vibrio cholerae]
MTALSETKKYQAYPEYKDSGVEWLGQIPAGWNLSKIAWHFRAEKGKNGQLLTKEYCGLNVGEHPVYSGQTENGGVMGKINSFEFDTGFEGVLFSTTVGAKAMTLSHLRGKFSLSQNCMIIASQDKNIVTRFAYYHFQPLFAYERGLIPEHMQASFRMEDLYRYPIATPSVEEQTQIANFLDNETAKIDTLIKKQQQLIKLLKEKRQAVISHAVTKGLNPQAPMKDSGVEWLGEVPEHWVVKPLNMATSKLSVGLATSVTNSYRDDGAPIIRNLNIKEGYFDGSDMLFIDEKFAKSEKSKVTRYGDVLMVRTGSNIGLACVTPKEFDQCHTFTTLIITPKSELNSHFLTYCINSAFGKSEVSRLKQGFGKDNLNVEELRRFQTLVPPYHEQSEIVEFLNQQILKIEQLITKSSNAVNIMKERRTALISAAVTGKIDVRNWQAPTYQNKALEQSA